MSMIDAENEYDDNEIDDSYERDEDIFSDEDEEEVVDDTDIDDSLAGEENYE